MERTSLNLTYMIKRIPLLILTCLLAMAARAQVNTRDSGQGHRLVIAFTRNDSNQMKALLNQLQNITAEWPEAQYEVVAYNFGLDFLLNSNNPYAAKIAALQRKGVVFVACGNTMQKRNISTEQLLPAIPVVKAAIPEIVLKQEQGWSYIVGGY